MLKAFVDMVLELVLRLKRREMTITWLNLNKQMVSTIRLLLLRKQTVHCLQMVKMVLGQGATASLFPSNICVTLKKKVFPSQLHLVKTVSIGEGIPQTSVILRGGDGGLNGFSSQK